MGFGELALIYNDKRSATILAIGDCQVYSLDGLLFKKIIIEKNMQKRSSHAGFLNSIKLFNNLDKAKKLKLVDGLEVVQTMPGKFVFQEGEIGSEFFIIESGEIECLKGMDDGSLKLIRTLGQGDHFGEIALIKLEPRSLSIRAKTQCSMLMLDREAFSRILGDIEKNLRKDYVN